MNKVLLLFADGDRTETHNNQYAESSDNGIVTEHLSLRLWHFLESEPKELEDQKFWCNIIYPNTEQNKNMIGK